MEQIRPLVVWSNLFGLMPLVRHRDNRKRCFLTLWCCIVLIFQLIDLISLYIKLYSFVRDFKGSTDLISLITILVRQVFASILDFVPRLIWLRKSHFQDFFAVVKNFDDMYGKPHSSSLKKRIFLGFCFGLAWGLTEMGIFVYYAAAALSDESDILDYFTLAFRCFSYAHLIFCYVSIHCLAVVLSERIALLMETFKTFKDRDCTASRLFKITKYDKNSTEELRLVQDLLVRIHRASQHFIRVYSPMVLLILVIKLIAIIVLLYRCFLTLLLLFQPKDDDEISVPATLILSLIVSVDIFVVLLLFFSADIPVHKMYEFNTVIVNFNTAALTVDEKVDLGIMMKKTEPSRVRLTAGGLFGVGKQLIPALMGTIATYLVILLQTGAPPAKKESS